MVITSAWERFWDKVDMAPGEACWEWEAGRNSDGYGIFHLNPHQRGLLAHRVAWFLTREEWPPEGQVLMHRCDNPGCVRPAHLRLGTQAENMADAKRKGRIPSRANGRHYALRRAG